VREDAYITLRYVRNLLTGAGFVYNSGEHVLGTSTPLYTLLLAAFAAAGGLVDLGPSPPLVATILGIVSDLVTVLLLYVAGARLAGLSLGLLSATLYAVMAPVVAYSVSGMETPLYVAMILAAFLAWDSGRIPLAGVLVGALAILRPDGILVGAVLVLAVRPVRIRPKGLVGLRPTDSFGADSTSGEARRRWSLPWQMVAWAALLAAPWVLFATLYFGSPAPQSMMAKVELGAEDPWLSLRHLAAYFTDLRERWFLLLTLVSLIGLTTSGARKPLARYLLAWAALYAATFTLTNKFLYPIWPFEWYFLPLLAPYAILAGLGLLRLAELTRMSRFRFATSALTILILVVFLPVLARQRDELIKIVHGRESLYVELARRLAEYGASEDVVAAPEIGALGYFYSGPILDVNALVSPEAQGRSFLDLVYASRPPWIVSYDTLIPDDLQRAPWFQREYRPVYRLTNWEGRVATLFRRYPPPEDAPGRGVALGSLAWLERYHAELQLLPNRQLLHVDVVWRVQRPLPERQTVFVHLLDGQSRFLAGQDNEPQEGTRPTTSWLPGEIILDRFDLSLSDDADLSNATLELGAYETDRQDSPKLEWASQGGSPLGPYLRLPAERPPAQDTPCAVEYGQLVSLEGVRVRNAAPGGSLELDLTWRALAATPTDYTAFVHVLDGQEQLVAQADGRPLFGNLPTSGWLPGDVVRQRLEVPRVAAGEAASIVVGMYDLATGRRLALASGADAIHLPLTVSPQDYTLDLCSSTLP